MIRSLHNRLSRMERRFAPTMQPPNFLVQFVGPNREITGTLTWENGEQKWWYAPGHEPDEPAHAVPHKTPDDPR